MSHTHESQVPSQAPWAPPCQNPYEPTLENLSVQSTPPAPRDTAYPQSPPPQQVPLQSAPMQHVPVQCVPLADPQPQGSAYAQGPLMPVPAAEPFAPGYAASEGAFPQPQGFVQQAEQGAASMKPAFGVREWLASACAVGLALLWFAVFGFETVFAVGQLLPGLGTTVYTFAFFAVLFAFSEKRLILSPSSLVLLVSIIALALIPVLFADSWLRAIDYVVLGIVCLCEFLVVSGYGAKAWCRLSAVGDALSFFVTSLFRHWAKPFKAFSGLGRGGANKFRGVAFGLLITLPILVVVLPLLMSADAVFGDYVSSLGDILKFDNPLDFVWKIARIFLVAPIMFSLVYAAMKGDASDRPYKVPAADAVMPRGIAATPLVTALVVMNAIYLIFVCIQFAYLFGGAESAVVKTMGYAEYARSGFFQLVAVAMINAALVLCAVRFGGSQGIAKTVAAVLELLLLVFTAVILVSAFWRMGLYINVFGLSQLRALTLFGMAFIAVCLVGAAAKVFRRDFVFFKLFLAAGISLWIVFNFMNVDARIAGYNVGAYLSGSLEQVDVDYLARLSPDAMPALDRLAEARPEYKDAVAFWNSYYQAEKEALPWQKWSLSYEHVDAS